MYIYIYIYIYIHIYIYIYIYIYINIYIYIYIYIHTHINVLTPDGMSCVRMYIYTQRTDTARVPRTFFETFKNKCMTLKYATHRLARARANRRQTAGIFACRGAVAGGWARGGGAENGAGGGCLMSVAGHVCCV